MRLAILTLVAGVSTGCGHNDARMTYTILDADPPVPIHALQTFEIEDDGSLLMPPSIVSGTSARPIDMPFIGGFGVDPVPPPFRVCVIARGESEEVRLSAVSPVVELVVGEELAIDIALQPVEGDEIPEPCGSRAEPFPEVPDAM